MKKLVSVLMCVYNTPVKYLIEASESILEQNYSNIEFVIVDDGSTDAAVCEYLDDLNRNDRVVVIRNKGNIGLTRSLNVGLLHCNGEYIARMDSDDISVSGRITRQVEYMEFHPEVALVGSGIICFGEGVEEKRDSGKDAVSDDPELYRIGSLIEHSGPPHPTFMFRGSFLRDKGIKYREDILKAQDYGIIADILKAGGNIRRIEEPLLKYRIHDGQITRHSEIEQKAYQCRVSYDLIKYNFPELKKTECAAIALLGCEPALSELVRVIKDSDSLRGTCGFIIDYHEELNKPGVFIRAIKKMIKLNKSGRAFDQSKLVAELRCRWWKKAFRTSKNIGRIWGMTVYTISSYRFVHNDV